MKYIRTKDGIEKVPNDYANKLVECPNLIIADTIEELCDEFVVVTSLEKRHILSNIGENNTKRFALQLGDDVYGAIWTGKGLIYVAKMNDKGELELL